ncbi:hypothetical protein FRACYDRAFT_244365 [Fragilariopsis cylindrus CCMP1102]|uniref:DUF6824 domain-containing protein n=1 Tax=Fragilariopsis cylindrus CCMP1102 TaxID=635003 RepID=A0A1E7F273_9STRA|nr:hypothetical protein FRACYDRAFT_244365 [Fragilariopsis cylindrus CCMP1102]|eukprot:OEU12105.1 hypothetical protein FRACYDRAFT_244365 [Fragilariopsis cylindrus CCMP1102]
MVETLFRIKTSLSDCNRRFENAILKQLQLQIDSNNDSYNSHSTNNSNNNSNNNIDTSILLDESIPDHFQGRIMLDDAYKEYSLGDFFEGNNSKGGGTTTSAYFEEYRKKKNKGVVGTDRRKAIIRSVDPLMEILMEESNDINKPILLHSSSSSKDPSRMDIKFKGRMTKETTTTTTTAKLRPITPAYNTNNNNNNNDHDKNGNGNGRVYRELTNNDIVFGRGGKANHHVGNVRYRKEIQRFEQCYKSAGTRSEKEWIVETVVHCLQSSNGSTTTNFLEKEVGTGKGKGNTTNCSNCWWFVVEEDIIRRKVHQALRENRDPKKRQAKRRRFLAKKAASSSSSR